MAVHITPDESYHLWIAYKHQLGCLIEGNFSTIQYCTNGGGYVQLNSTVANLTQYPTYFCALPKNDKGNETSVNYLRGNYNLVGLNTAGCNSDESTPSGLRSHVLRTRSTMGDLQGFGDGLGYLVYFWFWAIGLYVVNKSL
ncbi:uncharacterized protein L201_007516 [Kwoniella dendrophila CBS 6074]|uniref:Uncharacterized protein n=1 Tax=Kwoniella dendrophila CBS 6074 TaxID=1295534 RepID=A0AAX4K4S1_9TREE